MSATAADHARLLAGVRRRALPALLPPLVAAAAAVAAVSLLAHGLAGAGLMILLSLAFSFAAFAGWRAGLAAALAGAALGAPVAFAPPVFDLPAWFVQPASWASVSLIFAVLGALGVLQTGSLRRTLLESMAAAIAARRRAAAEHQAQRRDELALGEGAERLRAVFAATPDPIAVLPLDGGEPVFVNDAFRDTDGALRAALALAGEVRERGIAQHAAVRIGTPRGERVMQAHGTLLDAGDLPLMFAVLRDVTDERQADGEAARLHADLEARVCERTRELADATRQLEDLSYAVSHNLRAPIRALHGFAGFALAGEVAQAAPAAHAVLARVQAIAGRMGSLVDGMLELSRINRRVLTRQSVDVSRLAHEAAAAHLARAAEGATLDIDPGLRLEGDLELLRLAFGNLIGNAFKFSAQATPPRIEVRGEDGWIVVRDNGVGFNPAVAARLFEPFTRLHAEAGFPGDGLGLAMAARIARRHGGEMRADGRPGEGATFRIRLQAAGGAIRRGRAS